MEKNKTKDIIEKVIYGLLLIVWTTSIVFLIISGYFNNVALEIEEFIGFEENSLKSNSFYFLISTSALLIFLLMLPDLKKKYLD